MFITERLQSIVTIVQAELNMKDDIFLLMDLATKNEYSIPMKGIRYKFDSMEKQPLTQDDWHDMDTLMHYFGP
ncbi:hypothetical protein CIL06_14410 [Pantoea vagans]|uniref:Uncharacterized protein n=1 Tax=Pantoea vagans TaxID=470934 RepID=A0AAN1NTW6_9GAMM|nr:hypothetical protein C9381_10395 [Pantoea vagans]PAW37715.1 hypothetical protein CIL06_14410 [Pantoea vagans]